MMKTAKKPSEILLAEDSPADLTLVRRALEEHAVECTLHIVRDGVEAITWIKSRDAGSNFGQLDLLLLDMHLPKLDGEDILRCLRSTEHYAQTPVILMTSLDSSAIREKATQNAALVYFRKPGTLDEFMKLGSIVQNVLAGR